MTVDEQGRPEPPEHAGELATVQGFLEFHRATFEWKAGGLDRAGLARTLPPSRMSPAGMIRHLTYVEDEWTSRATGEPRRAPWASIDWQRTPDHDWDDAGHHGAEQLWADWHAAVDRSRARVARLAAQHGLDHAAVRATNDGRHPSLRWILVHLVEEYARHNGHLDLIRESIDGLTGE